MKKNVNAPLVKVMDLLLDAICVVDAQGRFVFVSAACERIFGYTPAEMLGRAMIELVHPDDRARTLQAAGEIMAGEPKPHFENRYLRKDGQVVHIMWSARWSEEDQLRLAVARDVTELKRAEAVQTALFAISEAAHATADLPALFGRIHQIIDGLLPARNFFVALHDREMDELSFPYFVDEYDEPPARRPFDSGTLCAEVIRSGQPLLITPHNHTALAARVVTASARKSLEWLGVPLATQQGVIGALVVQSYSGAVRYSEKDKALLQFVATQAAAAIERKQADTWLRHMAQHDALTDLPNRELFNDRLQCALAQARRDSERLALLYIDLDRFKQVNDTCGHACGDQLLREVARRICHCVRESDTVGRLGGDEFVVLLHHTSVPQQAALVAEKICAAIRLPFELGERRMQIAASIGITMYPEHGDDAKRLMRHADSAMYEVKHHGGNAWRIAATAMETAGDNPL